GRDDCVAIDSHGTTRRRACTLTRSLLRAALDAVDPRAAVEWVLHLEDSALRVGEQRIPLAPDSRIVVVGGGKAGAPMAAAFESILSTRAEGALNVKDGHLAPTSRIRLAEASHPLPDERAAAGVARIEALLQGLRPQDVVIALISGG